MQAWCRGGAVCARPDVAEGGGVVVGGDDAHRLLVVGGLSVRRVREAVLSPGRRAGWLAWAYHLDGLLAGYRSGRRRVKLVLIWKNRCVHPAVIEKAEGFCDDVVCEVVEVEGDKLGRS